VSDLGLVDRKIFETINRMEERNRSVRGLWLIMGKAHELLELLSESSATDRPSSR